MTTDKHGIELLQDPSLNKSTAFTEAEKQELGTRELSYVLQTMLAGRAWRDFRDGYQRL
jgi:hypothetical protein